MNNINVWLTTITMAALAGLVVLNFQGSAQILNALGGNAVNYVKAVQGR